MNLIGKIVGNRYEIISEAGTGGMATVYKAKDRVLNRNVAVKVLKDEYTTDQDFIKRFNSEAQSAAALSHPNIVSIYDVGHEEENNLYYIVMELIKGKTLKEIINKDGSISWKWAVNIAIQIASALEEAHKHGIIHRDIKPHNIIITEDGTAKVTDFGIAKAVSNSTITAFGTTIGSVHYFSPEQAKGGVTDARSDLYSLGVVMYEMLTGKVPFDADTPVSVALMHMQEKPKEPIELNSDIPMAVNKIVVKAMRKEPVERYQTSSEMLADLSEALKDPNGDFVVIENKDGEYTRVIPAVKIDKKGETVETKESFFQKHPKMKILLFILGLSVLFFLVFGVTKLILDGGFKKDILAPDFGNMTRTEVEELASLQNVVVEFNEVASADVEAGKVVSQEPPANKALGADKKVLVYISKGPETAALPDFVNKSISDVREKAVELGITLKEESENSDTIQENYVIRQSIKAGTEIRSGDTITVVVSLGAKKTSVPTVVGMDEGTAKATLSNAKLKANIIYESHESDPDGKVISQSIEQGKEVTEGTTIDVVVNKIEKKSYTVTLHYTLETEDENATNTTKKTNVVILAGSTELTTTKGEDGEYTAKYTGSEGTTFKVKVDGSEVATKKISKSELEEYDKNDIYLN